MELPYWIALSLIDDIGPITAKRLITILGGVRQIFEIDEKGLLEIDGIGEKRARAIKNFRDWDRVERIIKSARHLGIKILTQAEPSYPENLRTIPDPPLVLYITGEPLPEDRYAIAIVGSRKATDYGMRATERLSKDLAEAGITIVSGFARGIDTVAHATSLEIGGRTIGVFAGGLDRPYPPENKPLLKKILENGYIISEFPPGTRPLKENFPRRNRIISGLSLGVIVVEAAEKSGALITASYGLEQGREVFAVPGSIFSKNSSGTNNLIKAGAKLVSSARDVLEELVPRLKELIKEKGTGILEVSRHQIPRSTRGTLEFTAKEMDIIKIMNDEPIHIDEIIRKSGMSPKEVASILSGLELKGVVRQIEGKRFYPNNTI